MTLDAGPSRYAVVVGIFVAACLSCAETPVPVTAAGRQPAGVSQEHMIAIATPGSAPSYCDAALLSYVAQQDLDPDSRYRPVDGGGPPRCQGSYGEKHSLGDAVFVGLVMTCALDRPPAGGPFGLVWQPASPADRQLFVRVQSLSSVTHYSMDTLLPPGSGSVAWIDPDLARLGITPANLGVRIWWTTPEQESVYVPVSWGGARHSDCEATYRFQFDFLQGYDTARIRTHLASQPDEGTSWDERGDYGGPTATIVVNADRFPKADIYRVHVTFAGNVREQSFLFRATPLRAAGSG